MSFTWDSPVFFDELDPMGVLHNSRYAVHIERAQTAYFETLGQGWTDHTQRHPDLHYVVRQLTVDFLVPVSVPGFLRVEVTGERIGSTSATYGYVLRANGIGDGTPEVTHATGRRIIVKLDPATGRPAPWTDWYREQFAALQS